MSKRKPTPEPAPLALTQVEMLRLEKGAAEQRAVTAEVNLLLRERMEILAKIDPQGILRAVDAEIQKRKAEMAAVRQQHTETTAAIEQRLGIRLSEYSYDDVTGTLHQVAPEKGEEV